MTAINWLDRFFVSAFTIDDNGIANLTATETATTGDAVATIRGKYASASTPNASVVDIALPWATSAGSVWGIEVYVTAKGTTTRRRIKLSALVYGVGAVATLDGAVVVDAVGTGTPTATVYVNGSTSTIYLRLTPGTNAVYTWGYEIKAQQI